MWQPITSAPKDGTVVMLWLAEPIDRYYVSPGKAPLLTLGFFGSTSDIGHHNVWCSVEAKEEMWGMGGEYTGPMTATDHIEVTPTHWMPLPAKP